MGSELDPRPYMSGGKRWVKLGRYVGVYSTSKAGRQYIGAGSRAGQRGESGGKRENAAVIRSIRPHRMGEGSMGGSHATLFGFCLSLWLPATFLPTYLPTYP